jgi:hypothetical protein
MLEYPTVEIYPELIREAQLGIAEKHAEGMPIPQVGGGSLTGYLAELIVYDWLRLLDIPAEYYDSTDYDYLVSGRYRVDVKAMRSRSAPKSTATAEIFANSLEYQRPDYFLWVCLEDDGPNTLPRRAHILGGLSCLEFLSLAHDQRAGDILPNGFTYRTDRKAVYLNDLIPAEALAAEWRRYARI